MITESMTIQGLHIISLLLTPTEKWRAARSFDNSSSTAGFLTVFMVIALIIAVILLFWLSVKYRRSEHFFNLQLTELKINNVKLQQENDELTATNEKLLQENTELYQKLVEDQENIVNAETPAE